MRGAIHSLPQYAFIAWCLVKHRDNFTFTLTGDENMEEPRIVSGLHNLFRRIWNENFSGAVSQ
jgi:hypothetical protein